MATSIFLIVLVDLNIFEFYTKFADWFTGYNFYGI